MLVCKNEATNGKYKVFSTAKWLKDWILEGELDTLDEAMRMGKIASRNIHQSKVVDQDGSVVARFYDLFQVR